jgi:transcription initiation factor TFIIB
MQQLIICSACKNDRVITDHASGESFAISGVIISDKFREKQAYACAFSIADAYAEGHNTGSYTSLVLHDIGLSTIIGRQNRDANGHILDAPTRCSMERLRTWDIRIKASTPSNDRNLIRALNQLQTLKDKLGLPNSTVEKTAYIYRKAQKKGLVRGRTISAVLAAYVACRDIGVPRTLKEIAGAINIKRKILAKSYRLLINKLDMKIPLMDPMKCIIKVANNASLNIKTKCKAMAIMHHLNKNGISAGKDPMVMAATALYIACLKTDQKRTQIEIAEAAGITEVTLRSRYGDIKNSELDLIPFS